ncbi:NAD(+) synthase [Alkalibacter mobilis]|uniref:NAD(+) synthase n=1 Tax=Alkalibacter mobilis TaxID=2787712 RepID=UPI001CED05A5|nr:NAD(+) synthase [Alkalibacter mobilis]
MERFGFYRIMCSTPEVKVADVGFNSSEIIKMMKDADKQDVDIQVFPELCITGYTCADLFFQDALVIEAEKAVAQIVGQTRDKKQLVVVGAPVRIFNRLYNCAVAIQNGSILGVIPKLYLPEYNEFYEKRWFSSGFDFVENTKINYAEQSVEIGHKILFQNSTDPNLIVGVEICEDLWVPIPPSSYQSLRGATVILNPSASNDLVGKNDYRNELVRNQSARIMGAYCYSSAGYGESTTDVVYGGGAIICENGVKLKESERFSLESESIYADVDINRLAGERIKKQGSFHMNNPAEDSSYKIISFSLPDKIKKIDRIVWKHPFVPFNTYDRNHRCEEIFNIQISALAKRLVHTASKGLVVGISGGLDSTLALLVCVKTCDRLGIDRKTVRAITMPGFGTTDRTYNNALNLMKNLNVYYEEISIVDATLQHFKDIGHDPQVHNVTYENSQARERTQILMDVANRDNGLVVGTGDLSELALGWATYNGDHMSMYGVNSGIPKTLVRYLVKWIADNSLQEVKETLYDILDTPVSPELLPPDDQGLISQKTEEVVGPYELHDFYLYYGIRFGFTPGKIFELAKLAFDDQYADEILYKWLEKFCYRFISQQFKRSCLPDGPKVGSINLSPRGDWRMPSDASVKVWETELKIIKDSI